MDEMVGPPPQFNYELYVEFCPRASLKLTDQKIRRAEKSEWVMNGAIWESNVTREDLHAWREDQEIPIDVHLHIPKKYERPDQSPPGIVVVNYFMMEPGLCFPLHPNISHMLILWGIAPMQLYSRGWLAVLSLMTLLGRHGLYRMPTPAEINFIFQLNKGKPAMFLKARTKNYIRGIPSKLYNWQTKWFFVSGNWKSGNHNTEAELEIPTSFHHCASRKHNDLDL